MLHSKPHVIPQVQVHLIWLFAAINAAGAFIAATLQVCAWVRGAIKMRWMLRNKNTIRPYDT